jgi:FKBP-type peptidyl-prolyl cis-trans isomerase (trigger factor)
MTKHFSNIKIQKLPASEVEIVGEINSDFLAECKNKAIKKLKMSLELPGFRKGHVPENLLVQKIGEGQILEEAADIALNETYPEILNETKIESVGQPKVTIMKLALGNPLEFKIVVAVYPEFNLPAYKEIAKEELKKPEEISVTERDIDDVVMEIRKQHAHMELHKNSKSDSHDHKPLEEKDLPELTDGLVKQFGNFADILDFRKKISGTVSQEKIIRAKEKKRIAIIEGIMEKTEVEVPLLLIQSELEKMLAQFKDDIARAGLTYENYLKSVSKKEEDIKKEWGETATKKAKAQLVLGRIAEEEKISPDKEQLEQESRKIIELHKDADPLRVRMYVATMLLNEKVFQFLEDQK